MARIEDVIRRWKDREGDGRSASQDPERPNSIPEKDKAESEAWSEEERKAKGKEVLGETGTIFRSMFPFGGKVSHPGKSMEDLQGSVIKGVVMSTPEPKLPVAELKSPVPLIVDTLQSIDTSLDEANQQSKSTKRIAISTLIAAVLMPVLVLLPYAEWSPVLVDWFSSLWDSTTAWVITVFDKLSSPLSSLEFKTPA